MPGVEGPDCFAGGAVQRKDLLAWSEAEEVTSNDQRISLQPSLLTCFKGPGDFEVLHIVSVDLSEWGISLYRDHYRRRPANPYGRRPEDDLQDDGRAHRLRPEQAFG